MLRMLIHFKDLLCVCVCVCVCVCAVTLCVSVCDIVDISEILRLSIIVTVGQKPCISIFYFCFKCIYVFPVIQCPTLYLL